MDNTRIIYLHARYLQNRLTPDELQEWKALLEDEAAQGLIWEVMEENWERLQSVEVPPLPEGLSQAIMGKILDVPKQRAVKHLWPRLAIAAAMTMFIFAGGLFYYIQTVKKSDQGIAYHNDVAPGKNGATLTLANGKKIYINDAFAGNIAYESGVKISKTKDGQLIYEVSGSDKGALAYNTLTTTRGEQSQIRLPDGTLVFLNSESSLRYPTHFTGSDKRMVSLEGEGFFNVSKDKRHPFVVKTGGQEVEVLGTQFNINAYADENSTKTTLLEGSVRVMLLNGEQGTRNREVILKPNQEAEFNAGKLKVREVDAENAIAWKEGLFIFDDEPLENIMRRVARWYNVDVVYDQGVDKTQAFGGGVSRFENVSKVLKKLELTGGVHFKLSQGDVAGQERRITVTK